MFQLDRRSVADISAGVTEHSSDAIDVVHAREKVRQRPRITSQ